MSHRCETYSTTGQCLADATHLARPEGRPSFYCCRDCKAFVESEWDRPVCFERLDGGEGALSLALLIVVAGFLLFIVSIFFDVFFPVR